MRHRDVGIVVDGHSENSWLPLRPLQGLLLTFGFPGTSVFYLALKLKFTVAGFPSATVTFWV